DDFDSSILDGLSPSERLEKIAETLLANSPPPPRRLPTSIGVGTVLEACFVKSVSRQSSRFTLTLDPAAKETAAKDDKRARETAKKLEKLEAMDGFEGWVGMKGEVKTGVVVAASSDLRYLYVKVGDMPVCVCDNDERRVASKGDEIEVRMGGVDEERGQLRAELL
ncbi:hypothetical protein TeGR_g2950, partial [Tetraparma gracilis]